MEGSNQEICKDRKLHRYKIWCLYTIPYCHYILAYSLHFVKRNRCVNMHVSFYLGHPVSLYKSQNSYYISYSWVHACIYVFVCVCVCSNNFRTV